MLVHSKKPFLLPSVWPETEYTYALIWKSLLICFESYQGIPYSHTGRGTGCTLNTLLMVNLTLYVRASLENKSMFFTLKMLLCFEFCAFDFEAIPHPSCYLTSIVDKTHHGPVISSFSSYCSSYCTSYCSFLSPEVWKQSPTGVLSKRCS